MALPKTGILNAFEFFDNYDVEMCETMDDIPVGSIVACFDGGARYPAVVGTATFVGRKKLSKNHPDGEYGEVFVVSCSKTLRKKKGPLEKHNGWWRCGEIYVFPLEGHYLLEDRYCESVVYSGHDARTRREQLKNNWSATIVVPDATTLAKEAAKEGADATNSDENSVASHAKDDSDEKDDSDSDAAADVAPKKKKQTARKSQHESGKTRKTSVVSSEDEVSKKKQTARKTQNQNRKPKAKQTVQPRKSTRHSRRLRSNSGHEEDAPNTNGKKPQSAETDEATDATDIDSDDSDFEPKKKKRRKYISGGKVPSGKQCSKASVRRFLERSAQIDADFAKFTGRADEVASAAAVEDASATTAEGASTTTAASVSATAPTAEAGSATAPNAEAAIATAPTAEAAGATATKVWHSNTHTRTRTDSEHALPPRCAAVASATSSETSDMVCVLNMCLEHVS